MQANAIDFENYELLQDDVCARRIVAAKQKLEKRAIILAHHYQRADVYCHADLTGDSLKLSYLAARTDAEFLVFCGVHFMAEVADILSSSEQTVILPDLSAGCSMADMANLTKVERVWRELAEVLDPDERVTPVTYINSSADLKAFCGQHDGIVCTSSNAVKILQWAFARREKVLFFPDQHLGRWSGYKMGLSPDEMPVWDFDEPMGGLTPEQIEKARILLWKGHCSVHQMFQPQHILRFRNQYPDGLVISHPECSFEVCKASDYVGSTEYIINTIRAAKSGTHWLVGTELNLVGRIAEEFKAEGKIIQFMSPMVCMCSTMARIDPQHLAWSLENLAEGRVINQIRVPEPQASLAKLALEKMLEVSK
ncbi:quinolinate synthase NadA [Nitrosomonas sp. H1_AOB3]|uniref:quinolinate synthase NadA n=1 Tax=Nitrosomonas sp. H1_AOB3 TaxID=2741553 RepID=UPI001936C907|nr:quinolinate synthase NadA [Nitrosomonas sp. H1_AOB3]MBC6962968.1 quinolinate synthase NadA [Nitrosomonas sp.]MDL1864870.1 quinolinate synthase NadA [Betaproteobacteria bacterium PRO5]QOJ09864.1 MAG: quinolinate synthase NadA [Nitrosomonas sp. H1_AOB3]